MAKKRLLHIPPSRVAPKPGPRTPTPNPLEGASTRPVSLLLDLAKPERAERGPIGTSPPLTQARSPKLLTIRSAELVPLWRTLHHTLRSVVSPHRTLVRSNMGEVP